MASILIDWQFHRLRTPGDIPYLRWDPRISTDPQNPFYSDINIIRSPALHHKLKTCACVSLFRLSFRCPDDAETLILSCAPHTAHNLLPSRDVVYDLGDILRDSSECLAKIDVLCNFSFTAGMSHLLILVLITTRHPSVGNLLSAELCLVGTSCNAHMQCPQVTKCCYSFQKTSSLIHHPPLPPIFYSQCPYSANIVFLVLCIHSLNPQMLSGCQTKMIAKNKIYPGLRPRGSLLLFFITSG